MARRHPLTVALASLLGLAALPAQADRMNPPSPPSPLTPPSALTPPSPSTPQSPSTPPSRPDTAPADGLLASLKADAARRSGLPLAAVQVIQQRAVTWPDASLGCPVAGKVYAQMLTPGFQLTLAAGRARYDYHADAQGRWVRCPDDAPGPRDR